MTNEPSPRPWRAVENVVGWTSFIVDANGDDVAACWCGALGDDEKERQYNEANAALIVDAVNERDRLRDALNEVCNRVSVALNCPRHATEAIELLVHDLLGIKECARSAIGEDAP